MDLSLFQKLLDFIKKLSRSTEVPIGIRCFCSEVFNFFRVDATFPRRFPDDEVDWLISSCGLQLRQAGHLRPVFSRIMHEESRRLTGVRFDARGCQRRSDADSRNDTDNGTP